MRRRLHQQTIGALTRVGSTGCQLASADWSGQVRVWQAATLASRWTRRIDPGITKLAVASVQGQDALVCGGAGGSLSFFRPTDGAPLLTTGPGDSITALCNVDHESVVVCRENGGVEYWSPPYNCATFSTVLDAGSESVAACLDHVAVALGGTVVLLAPDLQVRARVDVSSLPVRVLRVTGRSLLVGNSRAVSEWTLAGEHIHSWAVAGSYAWSPLDADHWVVAIKAGDLNALGIVGSQGQLLAQSLATRWRLASVVSAADGRVLAGTYGGEIISWDPRRDGRWHRTTVGISDLAARLSRRLLRFPG